MHFENNNTQSTTVFDNLSKEYKEPLMKAIVAFEIEVSDMQNVFKLSQHRDKKSYENIIDKLRAQGGDAGIIADEMEKRIPEIFITDKVIR